MNRWRTRVLAGVLGFAATLLISGCTAGPLWSTGEEGQNVSFDIFAAASLTDVAPELIAAYNASHEQPVDASLNFAASSKLVAQINGGEKPALLITADTQAPQDLQRPEEYEQATDIATNHLVLAVREDSGIKEISQLPHDKTVAVCAPTVPCGRVATTYLANHPQFAGVFTEEVDVRSVLTKITAGQVDAGFVYATDAASAGDQVRSFTLEGVAPNTYPLLVSKDASSAARDFAQWLHTDGAKIILKKAGFDTP